MGVTIMKKVCRKLAKKYYTPLKKVKANKVFAAQMTDKLKAYDLMREINDDLVYYGDLVSRHL